MFREKVINHPKLLEVGVAKYSPAWQNSDSQVELSYGCFKQQKNLSFHILMFLWVNIHISDKRLVRGDIAISLDHGLHPPWHTVRQGREEPRVPAELGPGLLDLLGQLVQVRVDWHSCDDPVELSPQILYWVEIT